MFGLPTPNLVTVRVVVKVLIGCLTELVVSWVGTNLKDYSCTFLYHKEIFGFLGPLDSLWDL